MLRQLRGAAALVTISAVLAGCSAGAGTPESAPLKPDFVKAGALTVCTDMPYEPFEFEKGGKPVGFDIDLVNAVAASLKVKTVVLDSDFDDIQSGKALNSDACDVAISAMTITGERARVLDFSSPYFDASQAMLVSSGSGVTKLAGLVGQKVGVQAGTTGELYVTDNAPSGVTIVPFDDAAGLEQALKKKSVAAAVYDNTVVGDVIGRNPNFELAAEFDTGEQYGMAVKKGGNVDLLRAINGVLADLRDDGGYDKIYSAWFGG